MKTVYADNTQSEILMHTRKLHQLRSDIILIFQEWQKDLAY
jgi:hypothetical protein